MNENKCDTCTKDFVTCGEEKIVWGIDRDPSAKGKDADKVLECDGYSPQPEVRKDALSKMSNEQLIMAALQGIYFNTCGRDNADLVQRELTKRLGGLEW